MRWCVFIAALVLVSGTTATSANQSWAGVLRDHVDQVGDTQISWLYDVICDAEHEMEHAGSDSINVYTRAEAVYNMIRVADYLLRMYNRALRVPGMSTEQIERARESVENLLIVCQQFPGVGG